MKMFSIAAVIVLLPLTVTAQDAPVGNEPVSDPAAVEQAIAANVCPAGVASATFTAPLEITAVCVDDDATAFVPLPLLGGFAPAVIPGIAALAAVAAGGGGGGGATNSTTD